MGAFNVGDTITMAKSQILLLALLQHWKQDITIPVVSKHLGKSNVGAGMDWLKSQMHRLEHSPQLLVDTATHAESEPMVIWNVGDIVAWSMTLQPEPIVLYLREPIMLAELPHLVV